MLQQISAKRLLHRDYLSRLEELHRRVQGELAQNRAVQSGDFQLSGLRSKDQETMLRAKREFEALYQRSLAAAERLSDGRVLFLEMLEPLDARSPMSRSVSNVVRRP
jgi:hypothetical protein